MAKKAEVIITCDGTQVKRVLEEIDRRIKELTANRQALNQKVQDGVQLTKDEIKQDKAWEQEIKALTSAQKKNQAEYQRTRDVMRNIAGSTTQQLKRAYADLAKKLNQTTGEQVQRQEVLRQKMQEVQAQIQKNTGVVNKHAGAWGALGTTLKNLVAYMGVFAGFNLLKSKMDEAYEANKRFSDSMANVRKVSGLTMDEIGKLANNLSKIDSRTGLGGLMELSYTGAKLGFGNYGIEGLESFAKSAVKVQNALSEDMGADAMTALSKMVEVMGLIPKMGVERAMDATGSAIFKLASTSTATGTNIVEFSKRLMGLANIAHITTPELLAIGSAADSMALMPEVAATAFNKLITAVQKQPNLIENALHIEKGTISDMYQAGKMTDALVLIFEKMREKGGMNALMQSGVFKDLGSDGARLVAVMATMANRVDMLNAHLAVSREAFEEGTAVAQEYAIQMDTAAAYSERAANIWEKAFVNPEGVDTVKEFTKAWYEVSKALTSNKVAMAEVKFLLGGILELLKGILYFLPALLSGLAVFGAGRMFVALRSSLELTRLSAVGLTLSLNGIKTAWTALSAVGKANWIGAAATALFMIIEAFGMFNKKVKETTGYMEGFKQGLSDVRKEQYASVRELDRYVTAINAATKGTKERIAAINNFNKKYGQYISQLLTEKSTALDVAKAYNEVVKQMKAKIALQAKEKDIEKFVTPRTQWEADKLEAYDNSVSGTGRSQYNGTWLKAFVDDAHAAGKSIAQVAKELNSKVFHLSDESFANVYSQRGMDKVTAKGETTMTDAWGKTHKMQGIVTLGANSTEAQLQKALNYALQSYSTSNAIKRINKKYKPFDNDIAGLQSKEDEPTYDPLQDAPDKGAMKAAKKEAQERKQALRKEMEDAQKESTAVINAIEEFYRLQESAVEQLVADGKMTREEADKAIEYVKNRKDEILMNARRAIAGKDSDFEELRKTMGKDMLRPNDVNSQRALNTVQTIDVQKAAKNLQKFDGSKAVYDLNAGSFTQAMLKNAAQNELNIQRRQAAVQTEIDKILLQYQFVEQAQKTFGNKLLKLGLVTDGYDKVVQQLADGTEVVANTKEVQKLATKVVGMDAKKFYGVNPDDAKQLQGLIDDLMHTVDQDGNKIRESFASMFPNLDEWMQNPEQYKEQMQAFYKAMVDMDSDYYKALKQNYEQEKREFTERWQVMGWTDQEKRENTGFEMQGSLRKIQGEGENFGQTYGFADEIAEDPEIRLIKNRMEWRAKELEDLKARNASEELIVEKQNEMLKEAADLAEKVSAEVAERIGKIQTLSEPLSSFGEEVGTMLGEQWQGISREGKLTFGQMAKNMGIEYAKLTLKMASENLMKKLQQALFYKQMEMEEMQHQVQMTSIAVQGASARQQAQANIGQLGLITKSAQDTAEVGAESGKATIMTMFGISEGAAKIIAALGWWGIPLIGVITSILMALLNSAKSTASEATETASATATNPSAAATAATSKLRLGKGMLTYDEGNVEDYADKGRKHKYLGEDGRVYTATEEPAPKDGLVTHPIATTVQGQAALVAEKGPEIVLGRKTTRAIMMNEPELIRYLANYQQHGGKYEPRRLYDAGTLPATQPSDISPQTSDNEALMQRLDKSDELMASVLFYLQHPVRPKIEMFSNGGEDGMYESMQKATSFMRRYGK